MGYECDHEKERKEFNRRAEICDGAFQSVRGLFRSLSRAVIFRPEAAFSRDCGVVCFSRPAEFLWCNLNSSHPDQASRWLVVKRSGVFNAWNSEKDLPPVFLPTDSAKLQAKA